MISGRDNFNFMLTVCPIWMFAYGAVCVYDTVVAVAQFSERVFIRLNWDFGSWFQLCTGNWTVTALAVEKTILSIFGTPQLVSE